MESRGTESGATALPGVLRNGVRAHDAAVRQRVADSLGRILPKALSAIPHLVARLRDDDDLVRLKAACSYLEKHLQGVFSQFSVRTSPENFNEAGPELQLQIKQEVAKRLKINVSDLAAFTSSRSA